MTNEELVRTYANVQGNIYIDIGHLHRLASLAREAMAARKLLHANGDAHESPETGSMDQYEAIRTANEEAERD